VLDLQGFGRWLMIFGGVIALIGVIVWLLGRAGGIQHLPGTIRIETRGLTCVFPLFASIVLSIIITVILNLILRGMNR